MVELEALRVLAAAAPREERSAWGDAFGTLEEQTEYRQYRPRGAPSPNPGEFDALFKELSALYAS